MTPQEQLCEKMRVEQSAYCLWLTAQPPEEILHHAYEYSVREDIILATEEMNLTPAQVRALLKSPAPLADVYKDFSKLETDYMSICKLDAALLRKQNHRQPQRASRPLHHAGRSRCSRRQRPRCCDCRVAGRGPAHGGQCGCICKGRTGERQIPL